MASRQDIMQALQQQRGAPTKEQILAELQRGKTAPVAETEGNTLGQRILADLRARETKVQASKEARRRGEIGPIRAGYQQGGQAALAGMDIMGEGIIAAASMTPEFIKEPVKKGAAGILQTAGKLPVYGGGTLGERVPQELGGLFEKYEEFAQENPNLARDIEATVGYASILAPTKGKPKPKDGERFLTLDVAGKRFERAGKRKAILKGRAFAQDLVMPDESVRDLAERGMRGLVEEKGALRTKVIKPDVFEQKMAKTVSNVKGVKKSNSVVKNLGAVLDEANVEADSLLKSLQNSKIIIPKREVAQYTRKAVDRVKENPLLLSDAGELTPIPRRLLKEFTQLIDEAPGTPAGLLRARREFYKRAKEFRPKTFEAKSVNAYSETVKELGKAVNDLISEKVPNVSVKKSLEKQHHLLTAAENISVKMAKAGNNAIARAWKSVSRSVPLKAEVLGVGALVGGGGASLANVPMAPVLAAGGAMYLGSKALTSAQSMQVMGGLLRGMDKVIRTSSDKALVRSLRTDRAAILEFYNQMKEMAEEE